MKDDGGLRCGILREEKFRCLENPHKTAANGCNLSAVEVR